MKNLIKLFLSFLIITLISCDPDSIEKISLDDSSNEIEFLEGKFGAKEFEVLEKEALENIASENNESDKAKHYFKFAYSKEDVFNPILGQNTGKSTLIRVNRGVFVRYRSNKLIPGHAYTLWWVIWNKPGECLTPNGCGDPEDVDFLNPATEVDVLFAGSGRVIGNNGKGTFYGRLRAGNDSESVNDLMGIPAAGGIQKGNTFGAEVHLVLRSHGPAIPGMVQEQISGYTGGCTDPFAFLPFSEIPDEVGECGDIEWSLHAPVGS